MLEVLGIIGGIVLVDLVLSGDNALVIGAAAASLPRRQRYTAILAGGIGAIVLLSKDESNSFLFNSPVVAFIISCFIIFIYTPLPGYFY